MDFAMQLVIVFLLTVCSFLVDPQVFRSSCRRDTLMKVVGRNMRLTGTQHDIISHIHVADLVHCVKQCIGEERCLSINYMKEEQASHEANCHLTKITRSSRGAVLREAFGWVHYEPVVQPGPRCRNVICDAGFKCVEECSTEEGFDCIDIDECASNPCKNGGTCSDLLDRYTCNCQTGFEGLNCEKAPEYYTSCRELKLATNTSQNGVYILWNVAKTSNYSAYCHMSDGGWTLISRFSNADAKNWVSESGSCWYDELVVGATTSTTANGDMISKAFFNAKGADLKVTKSDSELHSPLFYANDCLSYTTFQAKITSYGNFRNNAFWKEDKCLGNCSISGNGELFRFSGVSQYNCNREAQSAASLRFWCSFWESDSAVMMIDTGDGSCDQKWLGIGIEEEHSAADFIDVSSDSESYALNLWIR